MFFLLTLLLNCIVAMRVTLAVYELDIESIIITKCYLFVLVIFFLLTELLICFLLFKPRMQAAVQTKNIKSTL